jgi:hypothetical protein
VLLIRYYILNKMSYLHLDMPSQDLAIFVLLFFTEAPETISPQIL